jgi:hypothetical protein
MNEVVTGAEPPVVHGVVANGDRALVTVTVPAGNGNVVLEGRAALGSAISGEPWMGAILDGQEAVVTFRVPLGEGLQFFLVRAGADRSLPEVRHEGPGWVSVVYPNDTPLTSVEQELHVLQRFAYGPTRADRAWVSAAGPSAYLEQQWQPSQIEESAAVLEAEAALMMLVTPREDTEWIRVGDVWRYFKGTTAPPVGWRELGFDASGWLQGRTGIGYGDGDDATVLEDMQQTETQAGYLTVFLRREFEVADPGLVERLILRVDFDDGFVAYLNGVEVARANVTGSQPGYGQRASDNREAGDPVEYDLTSVKAGLRSGTNVLAVQAHNFDRASSDLSILPALVQRRILPGEPQMRIRGLAELQRWQMLQSVQSRRQLQAVLGEFWDNHFTTDFDKVAEYFDDLRNSDRTDAMGTAQAAVEAAQVEFEEHRFFREHALGHFGDLLLYSASSPSMLIYLDSVANLKTAPNENYAREILELFGFGVDNRYTQQDIEVLARCFTGWTVRKVRPEARPAFPASVREPLTRPGVETEEEVWVEVGSGWRYFKGLSEPTPGPGGVPTLAWTRPEYEAVGWLPGATSIGYGDNDDATVLTDMRGRYASVYLRREFTVEEAAEVEGLVLSARVDDGFVAYLNGVEVGRSSTMEGAGSPPGFRALATGDREATRPAEELSLQPFRDQIRRAPEKNVLALQVHNVTLNSSDLSIHPRLVRRIRLPGSIEAGDPSGSWVFRFDPEQHDTSAKRLFAGTPHEMNLPAGRTGPEGVRDALEVMDAMVRHPSTREFIGVKLIQKFVSDAITVESYHNGTAPEGLRRMLDEGMAAWMSTEPPGHIGTVLRAMLRPATRDGEFWTRGAFRSKVQTPLEFVSSRLRALEVSGASASLPGVLEGLGMTFFTRDDPDGWSESGLDWMDTGSLLARVRFVQRLAGNLDTAMSWDVDGWVSGMSDRSADGWVTYFDGLLYGGELLPSQRELLVQFATTDDAGRPLPLDPARADYRRRVQDLVALLLALPQAHLQ